MHHIEIFTTTIDSPALAQRIIYALNEKFPGAKITIDLEDCDKVLRIALANSSKNLHRHTESILKSFGMKCSPMPD